MKLILTITSGTLEGQKFELETGFLTIGRSENCSIRFDPLSEKIASKQHAFIELKSDGFYIMDNSSTNGTLVNGKKIQSEKLNSGDTIRFGANGVEAKVEIQNQKVATNEPTVQYDSSQIQPTGQIKTSEQADFDAAFGQLQMPQFNQELNPSLDLRQSISSMGLGSMQAVQTEKDQTGKYIGIVATIIIIFLLTLFVTGLMVLQLGIIGAFIATFIAFAPVIFYILPLIWLDRYDPEPLWLLALAFSWGALVSILVSFVINTAIGLGVAITVNPDAGQIAGAVLSAPIFEEGSKGIGLLLVYLCFRKYFDGILDGIIFAGVIALGFATVENVLYYGRAVVSGVPVLIFVLFFFRGVLSPFAHVSFTAMTGIGCGISRETHNQAVKITMPIVGYLGAVILHMIWNGLPMLIAYLLGINGLAAFLVMYIILEVPFFAIFAGFAGYIMYKQNKILREMLAIDVARGLIPEEHFETATSAFKSTFWLLGSIFSGKFRDRSRYLRSIGKLGLSYWHIQRATAAQGHTASFQQNPILREEVLKYRDRV
jgi:RsiW-degrading membrane proteinase PrsW (M82 family)